MEGNLRFKIGWARLIVGMKFTVFGLSGFTLYLRVISNYKAPGGLYLTEGFLRYEFGGGGGGYIWRGLHMEGLIFRILR